MANVEYAGFFIADMVSLDEKNSGITVGTMSVIRLTAMDTAGGWAEWDSELAIRIHAAGYSSVYIRRPYGWGIIPETFAGYRKQRFRWSYGPVQELMSHARLFVPGRRGKRSHLSLIQQLHHCNHGLMNVFLGVSLLALPLGPATILSMIGRNVSLHVRPGILLAGAVFPVGDLGMRWLIHRRLLRITPGQFVGSLVASASLAYVVRSACLSAIFSRSAVWERTDKFRRSPGRGRPTQSTRPETVLAGMFLASAVAALAALPLSAVSVGLAFRVAWQGAVFAAAPVVSLMAHRDLQRKHATAGSRVAGRRVLVPTAASPQSALVAS